MIKVYSGEMLRLPVADELADKLAGVTRTGEEDAADIQMSAATEDKTHQEEQRVKAASVSDQIKRGAKNHIEKRTARTLSYCFNIFWSFVFLIFLNFYSEYFAIYSIQEQGAWFSYPLLTSAFGLWLPLINVALIFTIAGNIIMIINDRYIVCETVQIVINLIFIAALSQLLVLFPFNFAIIPHHGLAEAMSIIIRLILVFVVLALVITLLVRVARLILRAVKGDTDK